MARLRERPERAALFASLLGLLIAAPAAADPQLELSWSAPPNCPQESAVRQKLRAIWGESQPKTQRLHADGRIVRVGRRFRLTLTLLDGAADRSRSIDADSCADLAGAAAVTLGLLLRDDAAAQSANANPANETRAGDTDADPTHPAEARDSDSRERAINDRAAAASSNRGAAETDARAQAPKPNAKVPAHEAASRQETPRRDWQVFLWAPALALEWSLPEKPSIGAGGGAGLRLGAWRLGVAARTFLGQTLWSRDFPDAGVRVHRSRVESWTCRGFGSRRFEFGPCLNLGIDVANSRGVGADVTARSVNGVSLVVGAAAAGRVYFSEWLALTATLGFELETSRPRLVIRGLGQVDQRGPIALAASLGPEWIF